jgi:hypothetical protein
LIIGISSNTKWNKTCYKLSNTDVSHGLAQAYWWGLADSALDDLAVSSILVGIMSRCRLVKTLNKRSAVGRAVAILGFPGTNPANVACSSASVQRAYHSSNVSTCKPISNSSISPRMRHSMCRNNGSAGRCPPLSIVGREWLSVT